MRARTAFRLNGLIELGIAEKLRLPFVYNLPPVARQALGKQGIIFTVGAWIRTDRQALGFVVLVRLRLVRAMVEKNAPIVFEEAATPPTVSFGPQGECGEP